MNSKGSAMINVHGTDHETVKQLAKEAGLSMREMFEKILSVYIRSKGPEARKGTLVINIDMFKGSFNAELKMKPYKPWHGRTDTDDLREMPAEEATELYGPDRLPDVDADVNAIPIEIQERVGREDDDGLEEDT